MTKRLKRSKCILVRMDPETHANLLGLSRVLNVSASTISYFLIKALVDEADAELERLAGSFKDNVLLTV